jgi:alpha-L-arabinofuranosidase
VTQRSEVAWARAGSYAGAMFTLRLVVLCAWASLLTSGLPAQSSLPPLREWRPTDDPAQATIRVRPEERAPFSIPKEITGKFAEHLGLNIYNGMDAQILRNPTFADYPFWDGQMTPDGVTKFQTDAHRIDEELRRQARWFGWPASELDRLTQARADALACFWARQGSREDVQVSPDTGPFGGRAQRVQVKAAGQGVMQWTWLPLHRQRQYEFEVMARSRDVKGLTVSLWGHAGEHALCAARCDNLSSAWQKLKGTLTIPAGEPDDVSYQFTITADSPGQFVLKHAFLRPADHINGADPDVVRLLRQAHLPLLRWPGGNFVSTYHWRDGIGPVEARPTKPNYAWGAIEPNTFGTDEFIEFCRAVGCEPMICVNAGSGTPNEAAQWVEYCNGPVTTPMGRLRAENGHPEPCGVKRWEVGNELWGHWQMHWTTASGYVDRFKAFAPAMLKADPAITLYACGAPAMWGKGWNDTLIAGLGNSLPALTDHPLIGGTVSPTTEPMDIYRDFMAVPEALRQKWTALRDDMLRGGIRRPRLAVTELQLFAHLGASAKGAPARVTPETLPNQGSITEAIYDVLIYHAAIRLLPFVEFITHSAVINHGGGLRKERERVWANPCYYAQAAFTAFAEAKPVPVEITCAKEAAPMVLPDLRKVAKSESFGAVDALAAIARDGSLLLSIVHRGSAGSIHLLIDLGDFKTPGPAELRTLSAAKPWLGNSLEHPNAVQPADSEAVVKNGRVEFDLAPYSVMRVRIPPQG